MQRLFRQVRLLKIPVRTFSRKFDLRTPKKTKIDEDFSDEDFSEEYEKMKNANLNGSEKQTTDKTKEDHMKDFSEYNIDMSDRPKNIAKLQGKLYNIVNEELNHEGEFPIQYKGETYIFK